MLSFFPEPLIALINHLKPMKVPTIPMNPTIAAKNVTRAVVRVDTLRIVNVVKAVEETREPKISANTNSVTTLFPISLIAAPTFAMLYKPPFVFYYKNIVNHYVRLYVFLFINLSGY